MASFVYCWKNTSNGKRYIGAHKGDVNDGYVCSSQYMLEDYTEKPHVFVRQILAVFKDYRDAFEWESDLCERVKAAQNEKFYNKSNGRGKFFPVPRYYWEITFPDGSRKITIWIDKAAKHIGTSRFCLEASGKTGRPTIEGYMCKRYPLPYRKFQEWMEKVE